MDFYIKNMVCGRCERAVRRLFDKYAIPVSHLELGLVQCPTMPAPEPLAALEVDLKHEGFELARHPEAQLLVRIKNFVTTYLDTHDQRTFSEALSAHFYADYGHLSRQFSAAEGRTLEQYLIGQRIERAKELLQMGELTVSEIAACLGYRSNSHFSAQFKQHTQQTPTQFRKEGGERRFWDQV